MNPFKIDESSRRDAEFFLIQDHKDGHVLLTIPDDGSAKVKNAIYELTRVCARIDHIVIALPQEVATH